MATTRAAVIGLGTIGGSIARNLLTGGVETAVFDLRADVVDDLARAGARGATSIADAVHAVDAVLIAVVDDEQLRAVVDGDDGVLAAATPGTTIVVHSTVRPSTIRQLAAKAAERDVVIVDGGVSTGGGEAGGTLSVWVGGDLETFERLQPMFETYSHNLEHLGPLGSGMAAKLARNLLAVGVMAAVHEGMRLAEAAEVDLGAFNRVVKQSEGVNAGNLLLHYPTTRNMEESEVAKAFYESITGRTGDDLWHELDSNAALLEKDVVAAVEVGRELGVELEFGAAAEAMVRRLMLMPPRGNGLSASS